MSNFINNCCFVTVIQKAIKRYSNINITATREFLLNFNYKWLRKKLTNKLMHEKTIHYLNFLNLLENI